MNVSKIGLGYNQSNIQLNFVNANAGQKRENRDVNNNPPNALIRFNFLEVIVRNVYEKYVKIGQTVKTFMEAF